MPIGKETLYWVECNGCGIVEDSLAETHPCQYEARQIATDAGWTHNQNIRKGEEWWCPACSQPRLEKENL